MAKPSCTPDISYSSSLSIHKLTADVHLGISAEERKIAQKVNVDVRLYLPKLLSSATDDNGEYICYHSMSEKIYALCIAREYRLIEFMGQEIYRLLRQDITADIKLWINLDKPRILLPYVSQGVSFTYTDLPPGAWWCRNNMVVLGLGTNQGDREAQLRQAVKACKTFLNPAVCSKVYESPALLPEGAPGEWDVAFLNMAIAGSTALAPHELLNAVKAIEEQMGRVSRGHWGPREIDIDILAYDNLIMNEITLTIPHKELLKRDFALQPLADVTPDWLHPVTKQTASELASALPSTLKITGMVIA